MQTLAYWGPPLNIDLRNKRLNKFQLRGNSEFPFLDLITRPPDIKRYGFGQTSEWTPQDYEYRIPQNKTVSDSQGIEGSGSTKTVYLEFDA
jgi:hypothetical protein